MKNKATVGSASKMINYRATGTCIDYVYDILDTKYAFAFEIYPFDVVNDEAFSEDFSEDEENIFS